MSWPSSIFVGVLTAAVGVVVCGFVANLAVGWYRISSVDLQSTAFVASLAILGLVAGFIIGIIASRVLGAPGVGGFFKALGTAQGILLGLVGVIAGTARLLADVPPEIDGETLNLAVEIRWPASQTTSPASTPGEPSLMLGSVTRMGHVQRAKSTGPLWTTDAHLVDGRWVAPGAVDIFTTRGRLALSVLLDSTNTVGFMLPLSGRPSKKNMEWTEWYPRPRPGAPPLPDGFQYRYRVQKRSEPVRTESLGPLDVQTIAYYFYDEMYEGKNVLATSGRFRIRYRGQPVVVDAKAAETKADEDTLDTADGVALIAGNRPALLVHFADNTGTGPCYVISEASERLSTLYVPECSAANGSILTSDAAAFRASARQVPRGRVNRIAFAQPGLYSVGGSILDTRTLAVHGYTYPESFTIVPAVAPLGISPDERSFVRFGHDSNHGDSTWLAVADFVANRNYLLPIDESRMRYATLDALDPAWLMHHFTWEKGKNGSADSLVERKGFVPIPYHGALTLGKDYSAYRLEPAKQGLRDALLDFLVSEFKGERVSVESYAYEYPVKIDGQTINVAYGDSGHYVTVSVPTGTTDTKLLETVAKRIDAELATGKFDAFFGR
jgi:hypothetical protein